MYTLYSLKYFKTNKACKAIKFMIFYFTYTLKMSWRTISNLITLYSLFHSRFINLYSHQQFEFFRKYRHGNTPHMGCQSYMDFNQLYTLAVWQNLQPPYTPHFVIFQLPGVKSTIDNGRNKGDTWVEVFGWWCFVRRGEQIWFWRSWSKVSSSTMTVTKTATRHCLFVCA